MAAPAEYPPERRRVGQSLERQIASAEMSAESKEASAAGSTASSAAASQLVDEQLDVPKL